MREQLMDVRGARRRLSGVLLVGGLFVAGCSDAGGEVDPTPEPSPDVTATAAPTETESPAPGPTPWPEPTRPEAMERDDIEGAKAAAEYFLALHPYIFATGRLEEWQSMSHPSCEFCSGVGDHVAALFSDGGYGVGGDFVADAVLASEPTADEHYFLIGVSGTEAPSVEYSTEGEVLAEYGGGAVTYQVAVLVEDGDWKIFGINWEE